MTPTSRPSRPSASQASQQPICKSVSVQTPEHFLYRDTVSSSRRTESPASNDSSTDGEIEKLTGYGTHFTYPLVTVTINPLEEDEVHNFKPYAIALTY